MAQSSPQLMGVCPPLGAAVLLSLQYGYNAVGSRNVLWLQNFLLIKNWPFYVIRLWRKGVGKSVCCRMICLLNHSTFAKCGSQCRRLRSRSAVVGLERGSSYHCKVALPASPVMGEGRWRSLPSFSTWKRFGEVFCFFSFM